MVGCMVGSMGVAAVAAVGVDCGACGDVIELCQPSVSHCTCVPYDSIVRVVAGWQSRSICRPTNATRVALRVVLSRVLIIDHV